MAAGEEEFVELLGRRRRGSKELGVEAEDSFVDSREERRYECQVDVGNDKVVGFGGEGVVLVQSKAVQANAGEQVGEGGMEPSIEGGRCRHY